MQPKALVGFTLVELVIVIVVLGIISVYAVVKSVSPAEITLPSQAQTLASDIRHAQTLAYTWGKRMRLSISAGTTYSVSCVTGASGSPCNTSNDFSVTLKKDVVLAGSVTRQDGAPLTCPASASALEFNSLGQPVDCLGNSAFASYTLTSGSSKTVFVAALTGLVTVSP
jgi:MSHA pilin protein MshC